MSSTFLISIKQLAIICAGVSAVLLCAVLFGLIFYQGYLFTKIRSTQLGLNYKWYDYLGGYMFRMKSLFKDELHDERYDFIFNTIIRTPVYFIFVDLEFENEDLRLLNQRRIKVCKLIPVIFLILVGIILLFD